MPQTPHGDFLSALRYKVMSYIPGGITDTELRASPVEVGLTDQLLGVGDLIHDAWGLQKISYDTSLFYGLFTFDIPAKMWLTYENDVETTLLTNITSVGGQAYLAVDATITTVRLDSREAPRYQPNRGHLYSDAGFIVGDKMGGTVEHGLATSYPVTGNIENGVFFRHKPDGLLYAVLYSGGSQVKEELIDLSAVDGFDPNFDTEKNQIYGIQWRSGAGDYFFYIGNPLTGRNTIVKTLKGLGLLAAASMENPANTVSARVVRGTGDIGWRWGCVDVTSENGVQNSREVYTSAYTKNYSGLITDFPVIVFHQPLLINATPNTRNVTLARLYLSATQRTYFEVWITRDPTNIVGATFRALPDSFLECDSTDMDATAVRATSVALASLVFITFIRVEANVRAQVDNPYRERIEFPIVRGDYLVITCNKSSAVADAVVEFGESV